MMSRLLGVGIALAIATVMAAEGQAVAEKNDGIRVVATIAPLVSFTMNIAGERGSVEMLYPPSQGPHDYAFSPSDIKKLQKADVLVMNGLELESGLDRLIESLGRKDLVVVNASEGLDLPKISEGHPASEHDEAHDDHGHTHGGVNPHVWLDPVLAIGQVRAIARGLAKADPAGAATYLDNAEAYVQRLEVLDSKVRAMLVSLSDKRIITFHNAFPYFAKRYGIEVAEVFQVFPGRDPTPSRIAKLRSLMGKEGVRAVFAEPQYSPKLLESIAADLGVPVRILDPMGTGKPSPQFYEQTTLANAQMLVEALGQDKN